VLISLLLLASAALAVEPERDDPRARAAAMRAWEGDQGMSFKALQAARRAVAGPQRESAVPGNVFVNLGPAREDSAFNGAPYTTTDSGRVRQILPHPANPNILYLATAGGGVWKTWDHGAGWEPLGDRLGALSVGALAMDPASPEILYLGLGDPFGTAQAGFTRSLDGGASWSAPIQLQANYAYGGTNYALAVDRISDIQVDPQSSLNLFVATNRGFFRSADGGQTFSQIALSGAAPGDIYFQMWSVAWVAPNTWLATGTRQDLTGKTAPDDLGFWRSVDNGVNWIWNAAALPGSGADRASIGRATLAVAPGTAGDAASARVFLLAANGLAANGLSSATQYEQKDLYRSEDGGQHFVSLRMNATRAPLNPNEDQSDLNVLHDQSWYNQAIIVDPQNPDLLFVGGNLALVRSNDGGVSWSVMSDWLPAATRIPLTYVHADFHAFAIGPAGDFFAGSDGGLYRSASGDKSVRTAAPAAASFDPATNQGLVTHLAYHLACAPESWPAELQGYVVGGLQDNGTRLRAGNSTTFNQIFGGDGIGVAVSADVSNGHPSTLLATVPGKIVRTTDGGTSWSAFTGGLKQAPPFLVRLARDAADPLPDAFLTFTAVAQDAAGRTLPGSVFRSAGGADWTDVGGLLHWQTGEVIHGFVPPGTTTAAITLRNLATHPAARVWGAVSNKFAYVTSNGGADWFVSKQPAAPGSKGGAYLLSSIAFDPGDPSGKSYFVTSRTMLLDDGSPVPASMGHLFKTTDGGATWTFPGAATLPFVPFEIVRFDPGDPATVYVGTDAGLWRSRDAGATFQRYGGDSLPLARVTDVCIAPASRRLTVSTFGRGFWEIDTSPDGNPAGVKGNGDTNLDQRWDGVDLMDLADALGATQASDSYRAQADLVGDTNAVDDSDLAALLLRFGGSP
jgi:hypothetical protein